jgi:hypothetical protein
MQQGAAALGMTEDAYQTLIRKIADRVAVGIVQQNSTGHTAKFLKEAPAAPGRQVFRLPDTTPKHPKKQGGKVRAAMAVKLGKGKPIK